jgi:hypothetical protein
VGERCRGERLFALPLFSHPLASQERGKEGVRTTRRVCPTALALENCAHPENSTLDRCTLIRLTGEVRKG